MTIPFHFVTLLFILTIIIDSIMIVWTTFGPKRSGKVVVLIIRVGCGYGFTIYLVSYRRPHHLVRFLFRYDASRFLVRNCWRSLFITGLLFTGLSWKTSLKRKQEKRWKMPDFNGRKKNDRKQLNNAKMLFKGNKNYGQTRDEKIRLPWREWNVNWPRWKRSMELL